MFSQKMLKPSKDKKTEKDLHGFSEILDQSKHEPNKLWVDQGRELYNNFMHKWLDCNDISMHSTRNEGKSIGDERFIRTLKGKNYKKNDS